MILQDELSGRATSPPQAARRAAAAGVEGADVARVQPDAEAEAEAGAASQTLAATLPRSRLQ